MTTKIFITHKKFHNLIPVSLAADADASAMEYFDKLFRLWKEFHKKVEKSKKLKA